MAPQGGHELFGRLGRLQNGSEKGIPVRADEHHPFMLVERLVFRLFAVRA